MKTATSHHEPGWMRLLTAGGHDLKASSKRRLRMVNFASLVSSCTATLYTIFFFVINAPEVAIQQFLLALIGLSIFFMNLLGLRLLAKHTIMWFLAADILIITSAVGHASLSHLYLLPSCVLVWMIFPIERRKEATFFTLLIMVSFLLCEFVVRDLQVLGDKAPIILTVMRYCNVIGSFSIVGMLLYVFASVVRQAEFQLREMADTDVMTGAKNRRHFEKSLKQHFEHHQEHQTAQSLVMMDIDHFKRVNDTWGHDAGDEVIRQVATIVQAELREEDDFARVGGEEFCVLLHGVQEVQALKIAERFRANVEKLCIQLTDDIDINVTISLGVTEILPDDSSMQEAWKRADQALYRSKNMGRNQVQATCSQTSTASSPALYPLLNTR